MRKRGSTTHQAQPAAAPTGAALRRELLADESGPGAGFVPAGRLRVALVYPHTYEVGMSSLGYQIVWRMLNDQAEVAAERFFTDTQAAGSLETGTPLGEFDILAFSAAYEMDDPLVIDVLEAARLPLAAHQRGLGLAEGGTAAGQLSRHRSAPLVLMGGVLVGVNRAPLYPFIDVFCHGEAEAMLPGLLARCLELGTELEARHELLPALAELPGLEVTAGARAAAGLALLASDEELLAAIDTVLADPLSAPESLPAPPQPPRQTQAALGSEAAPWPFTSQILSPRAEFNNMALVDLARGCPHHCTFCWIGHNAPAYRTRPLEQILTAIERLAAYTPKFGLVASAVGAHPQIDELCGELMARGLKVSYSSLRVEEVSETMLRALAAGGGKTVTIAPEAGNRRVRRLLGKKITDEQILDVADKIFGLGADNMKLYMMLGIPSETDEEALEIATFTARIREVMLKWGRPRGRIGSVAVNLGVYVPKPNLPLNHIEPVPLAAVRRRLKLVTKALARIPNTHVNVASPELARAQAVLSMGGLEAAGFALHVRARGMAWREAVRDWDRRHATDYAWRFENARLSAARLAVAR